MGNSLEVASNFTSYKSKVKPLLYKSNVPTTQYGIFLSWKDFSSRALAAFQEEITIYIYFLLVNSLAIYERNISVILNL